MHSLAFVDDSVLFCAVGTADDFVLVVFVRVQKRHTDEIRGFMDVSLFLGTEKLLYDVQRNGMSASGG